MDRVLDRGDLLLFVDGIRGDSKKEGEGECLFWYINSLLFIRLTVSRTGERVVVQWQFLAMKRAINKRMYV